MTRCSTCRFAGWFEDRSVGIQGHYECNNEAVPDGAVVEDDGNCPWWEGAPAKPEEARQ